MACFELVGGFYTNSTAILSDALHDFGDAISLGMSWFLEKLSRKKGDAKFSFGYRRFSLLGAFINSTILLVGSVFILREVIPRLLHPEPVDAKAMVLFAIVGLAVNGYSVFLLKGGKSYNEKVVTLHLLEDVLGWAAVLIGALVMSFIDIPVLDPILSLLITLFILKNVYVNIKDVAFIFLQGTPKGFDLKVLEKKITDHTSIRKIYHVHVWSIDGEKHVLTAHVLLKSEVSIAQIKEIQTWVHDQIAQVGLWHSTIQFEVE